VFAIHNHFGKAALPPKETTGESAYIIASPAIRSGLRSLHSEAAQGMPPL
jgi:hypothetical protein